jgi:ATP-dependent RNA helicase DDX60
MDVEFETLKEDDVSLSDTTISSPQAALAYFDEAWYIRASRRARRMDIIGDYAGNERFVIDGRIQFWDLFLCTT